MTPWTASSFKKHNKKASPNQLKAAAHAANSVLKKTGDEGRAVRAGNSVVRKMKRGQARR